MAPVTEQHRLVVDRKVIEWDFASLKKIEGEDTRHRYSAMHQFTHITTDRDCLVHDDRLDALGTGILDFADILGVDPQGMASRGRGEREEAEWEKLFGDLEEDDFGVLKAKYRQGSRAVCLRPTSR
jgi:hypothetical protein